MDAEGSQKRQCTSVSADNGTRNIKSEQAHGAATGKSGETEVKPLQTISTQITDHDLRGTKLSDINEKALEDQAVPEDQPARPETEMKDQENLGSEVNPSRDSWSDPCLEFAFKTLTGALVVENNVATTQGYFQNKSTPLVLKLMPVSVPQLPMNPTYSCCRMWSKIEKWIATLEFDRDRKSMGVMVSSSSGRKSLLVKTRNAIELVVSAIAAGLGALTHTLGTLVPVIGANGFATATAATATAIGTIVGSFR
ncbi:unnamed protein product [Camellia sinensis]